MTIKELIDLLKEFSEELPDKLNSEVCIGHTYGEQNIVFNEVFYYNNDGRLEIIDSYYHYFVKHDDKTSRTFLYRYQAEDYIKENHISDWALWRVQNEKAELEDTTDWK